MQEPRRPAASDRSLRRSAALARAGRVPVALRAMIVLDRDAEDAIVAEARREALDEARAVDRLLARAGKPRGVARQIAEERLGMQCNGDGRGGKRQAAP